MARNLRRKLEITKSALDELSDKIILLLFERHLLHFVPLTKLQETIVECRMGIEYEFTLGALSTHPNVARVAMPWLTEPGITSRENAAGLARFLTRSNPTWHVQSLVLLDSTPLFTHHTKPLNEEHVMKELNETEQETIDELNSEATVAQWNARFRICNNSYGTLQMRTPSAPPPEASERPIHIGNITFIRDLSALLDYLQAAALSKYGRPHLGRCTKCRQLFARTSKRSQRPEREFCPQSRYTDTTCRDDYWNDRRRATT